MIGKLQVTKEDYISLKIFELKIEAHPVYANVCMAFKLGISFEIDLAANLVVINSESCQRLFPSFVNQ